MTDTLPSWIGAANHDPATIEELMLKWSKTQELLQKSVATLDPVRRIEYLLNERVENKVVKGFQIYQFLRIHKLLRDPANVLQIQIQNPDWFLLEDHERELAESWNSYLTDRDFIIDDANFHYVHASPNTTELDARGYEKSIDHEEADTVVPQIMRAVAERTQNDGVLPVTFTECYLQEVFRQGLFKGRLRAEY